MTAALVYRALERNTPGIGNPSAPCVSESAKNPEIAALTQVRLSFPLFRFNSVTQRR